MPLIKQDSVYKRALSRINDLELINISEEDFYEIMAEWLYGAIATPLLQKSFASFNIYTDEDEVTWIDFRLRNETTEFNDKQFVTNILAKGLAINYLSSQLEKTEHLAVMIGGKEEKKLIDNYKPIQERIIQLDVEYKRELSQHGYYFGTVGETT